MSASAEPVAGWPIEPGRRVRLRVSIWDDGGDCHPPGFNARAGDVLHVFEGQDGWLTVSHSWREVTYNTFLVKTSEVELYWEQLDLFPEYLALEHLRRNRDPLLPLILELTDLQ